MVVADRVFLRMKRRASSTAWLPTGKILYGSADFCAASQRYVFKYNCLGPLHGDQRTRLKRPLAAHGKDNGR
jgi:hypothetical protein